LALEEEADHAKKITKLKENWGLKTHGGHCPIGRWVGMYIRNELFFLWFAKLHLISNQGVELSHNN
jgi:hypothetical protein